MNHNAGLNTLLQIPLIEERYGRYFFVSIAFHAFLILLIIFGGYLIPARTIEFGGSHPGGGPGEDIATVGVVDGKFGEEKSGGEGTYKPTLIPAPPVRQKPQEDLAKAINLKGKPDPKSKKPSNTSTSSNVIPTDSLPGNSGAASYNAGRGGGLGGGHGIDIGPGSGGPGNSLYEQLLITRINNNWVRPVDGTHVEIIYSFYIAANGTLYNIKKEKTSGNLALDLTAESALNASFNPDPLPEPPLELRRIKFVARFLYPFNQ
jgi:hypothetical protein